MIRPTDDLRADNVSAGNLRADFLGDPAADLVYHPVVIDGARRDGRTVIEGVPETSPRP